MCPILCVAMAATDALLHEDEIAWSSRVRPCRDAVLEPRPYTEISVGYQNTGRLAFLSCCSMHSRKASTDFFFRPFSR
jgi:hypothetical protein